MSSELVIHLRGKTPGVAPVITTSARLCLRNASPGQVLFCVSSELDIYIYARKLLKEDQLRSETLLAMQEEEQRRKRLEEQAAAASRTHAVSCQWAQYALKSLWINTGMIPRDLGLRDRSYRLINLINVEKPSCNTSL